MAHPMPAGEGVMGERFPSSSKSVKVDKVDVE